MLHHQHITLGGESLTHNNVVHYVRMAAICSVYEIGLTSLVTSPYFSLSHGDRREVGSIATVINFTPCALLP